LHGKESGRRLAGESIDEERGAFDEFGNGGEIGRFIGGVGATAADAKAVADAKAASDAKSAADAKAASDAKSAE
jgi:hypothetical protein